ncbi:MAG: MFS transporter [Planctomycetes bacterium]|jgi:MFS family permease|nr:MFS transporter [Planctomycetota bacterium]
MAEPQSLSPEQRRGVFTVWLIIFIDLLGFGIVLPSLAYYVKLFAVPDWAVDFARTFGLEARGGVLVGLIMTCYSLAQFLFAPVWGRLSDKLGRKPILALSTAGFALTWIMFALATDFVWLLLSRTLAGVCAANLSTAQAYMADVFPPERRAKGMGLIGMAFGLGFVFGPAIGGALTSDWFLSFLFTPGTEQFARAHLFVPALFAAGLSTISFTLTVFALRESLSPELRAGLGPRKGKLAELLEALRRPAISPMLVVYFVVTLGFANLEAMFSQFNADYLRISTSANAWVFVAIGLTLAFVQGGLIGRLTKRLGSARVLAIGLGGLAAMMFVFGFQRELNPGVGEYAWLVLVAVGIGAFNGLCNPSILAIISSHARADAQGGTMGFTASAATLGRIAGPILGGVVYDAAGPQWPFALGGTLIALGLLVLAFKWRVAAVVPSSHMPSSNRV